MNNFNADWNRRLIRIGVAALLILLLFSGYQVLRSGAGRLFGDFFYPYLEISRLGSRGLADQSLLALSHSALASRCETLQEQNRILALQAAAATELLEENDELRRLGGLRPPAQWNYIGAEIILRDPLDWQERFTINRGEADALVPGAAALTVSPDGRPLLVGVVERVGKRSSTVITLFNPALRVSGSISSSGGAVGFLNCGERTGRGRVPLGFLPAHLHYTPGAAILSTGFEANIPGGILLGFLDSVEETDPVYSNVTVLSGLMTPATDFNSLRFLVVCRRNEEIERP